MSGDTACQRTQLTEVKAGLYKRLHQMEQHNKKWLNLCYTYIQRHAGSVEYSILIHVLLYFTNGV